MRFTSIFMGCQCLSASKYRRRRLGLIQLGVWGLQGLWWFLLIFVYVNMDTHSSSDIYNIITVTSHKSPGHFKNAYALLNQRTLKISALYTNVWARHFVWNFKGSLINSSQNIFPIHWKMCILFRCSNWRALRFKSLQVFLKRPLTHQIIGYCYACCW